MKMICKPIEMIAQHTKEGKVIPIRFRIEIDGELKTYNVKIRSQEIIKVDKIDFIAYACTIEDEEYKKECEIRFNITNTQWVLYRM